MHTWEWAHCIATATGQRALATLCLSGAAGVGLSPPLHPPGAQNWLPFQPELRLVNALVTDLITPFSEFQYPLAA